jgi:uncharacterized protein YukE
VSDFPQFDHDKARNVVEQQQSAIRVLNQQTSDRAHNAKNMQRNWTGHHANQFFDTEIPRIKNQAANLVRRMEGIIRAVQSAAEAASAAEAEWRRRQPQPPSPRPGPPPTPPPRPGG